MLLNHSNCGTITLQKISTQKAGPYGPIMRFLVMNHSYSLPLSQPMNTSVA